MFESVGKKTSMMARFSTVGGEKGSSDSTRDVRGFALKFYTEEGNWDIAGNNTPGIVILFIFSYMIMLCNYSFYCSVFCKGSNEVYGLESLSQEGPSY